jgi:hypothetical protein
VRIGRHDLHDKYGHNLSLGRLSDAQQFRKRIEEMGKAHLIIIFFIFAYASNHLSVYNSTRSCVSQAGEKKRLKFSALFYPPVQSIDHIFSGKSFFYLIKHTKFASARSWPNELSR